MQTAKERAKNRNYYLSQMKKNYKMYRKYLALKNQSLASKYFKYSSQDYDRYKYNGGTKKAQEIIKSIKL